MHAIILIAALVLCVNCTNESDWSESHSHSEVSLGMAKLATFIEWFDPEVNGEPSVFRFAIKFNYDQECSSKAHFKENTEFCLRKHAIILADDSSDCRIVVTGNQWVNTYRKLFVNVTLLGNDEVHFLRVKTCNEGLAITDFIILPSREESTLKYLPYELNHFRRLFQFEVPPSPTYNTLVDMSVDTLESCLPERDRFIEEFGNNTSRSFQCVDVTKKRVMNKMLNLLNKRRKNTTDWPANLSETMEHAKVNFMKNPYRRNPYNNNPVVDEGRCKPRIHDDTIECSAARHLGRTKRHLYMIAMYVQVLLLADYLDDKSLNPGDLQVCIISDMSHVGSSKWFYRKLTASFTGHGNSPTLVECCRMMQKLKIYGVPGEHKFRWHCHDPYQVPNLILLFVNIGSYLIVLVFPLLVRFLPSCGVDIERIPESHSLPCDTERQTDRPETHSTDTKTVARRRQSERSHQSLDDRRQSVRSLERKESAHDAADVSSNKDNGNQSKTLRDGDGPTNHCHTAHCDVKAGDLVFLDRDPVYRFGVKTIISYILLSHVNHRCIIILRRFLFLYIAWILVHFASFLVNFFYPSLAAHYQVITYGTHEHYYKHGAANSDSFFKTLYVLVLILPLIYATVHFMCLSPVLCRKESISQLLYWEESATQISKYIDLKPDSPFYESHKPFQIRLYRAMLRRLRLLFRKRFWQFMFEESMVAIPVSKEARAKRKWSRRTCTSPVILLAACFIKLPAVIFAAPFYVFPCFTFFYELFMNQGNFLKVSNCNSAGCRIVISFVFSVGVLLSLGLCLSFSFLYGSMVVFAFVDVVRNLRTNVNHGVLFVSVLLYVQNAFVRLEDQYRTMKKTIFKVCKEIDEEITSPAAGPNRNRLIWTSRNGEKAVPKNLFIGVCNRHRPYSSQLLRTCFILLLNLSLVFFLYVLVIDFQALDQFTGIGQSLMTIFTVSLPGLIGKLRSEAAAALDEARLFGKVKATVKDIVQGQNEDGSENDVGNSNSLGNIWRREPFERENQEWV